MTEERLLALKELESSLSHSFGDISRLDQALVHRSYVNENPGFSSGDNERMEFLGDAVLELCITDLLMKTFPDYTEGQLSKLRASVVNEQPLAELARELDVGRFLLLGKGEESSGGRSKASILANTFEAIIAAVYLDGGFDRAYEVVRRLFSSLIEEGSRNLTYRDYKTTLQELSQNRFREIPRYSLIGEYGPDHDKIFESRLAIPGVLEATGKGKSKKEAEQNAARSALDTLLQKPDEKG
ncbi:RNAse III [Syntrophus gentianae]|uniref:Ribonuclease 3 n=1 Tax=Syntrophus gentianae TaxID=43775 RepID=A0A1H7YAY6_9BACT|nr:ribonuclease III [Syntrophus gentianae]SEM43153.1 RNAse III [Syntrophus gentianae]